MIAKDSLVTGVSRFLNKAYFNDISIAGETDIPKLTTTQLIVNNTTDVGATTNSSTAPLIIGTLTGKHIAIDQDEIMAKATATTRSPLYLNYDGGTVYLSNGSTRVSANNGTLTATTISATNVGTSSTAITNLYATNGKFSTIDSSTLTASKIGTPTKPVDEIIANKYDIISTQNLGGSFMVAPTVMLANNATFEITTLPSTATNGFFNIVATITDSTNLNSNAIGGGTWTTGSKIVFSGKIKNGTTVLKQLVNCYGEVNSFDSGNTQITLLIKIPNKDELEANPKSYTIEDGSIMMYEVKNTSNNTNHKIGIYMKSVKSDTFIDMYNGANGDAANSAKIRLGYLNTLGTVKDENNNNLFTPTGWGLFADNVFLKGSIVASGGKIAGWTIGESSLSKGTQASSGSFWLTPNGTSSNVTISGTAKNTWGITLGDKFGVTTAGELYSSSGKIGGWTIGASSIYRNITGITSTGTTAGEYFGENGLSIYKSTTAYTNISASTGVLTAKGAVINGEITATSGKIGGANGFSIDANKIYSGSHSTLTAANDGVYVGTDGISLGNGKFKVTNAGALTSTSGSIAGWNINSNYLLKGTIGANDSILLHTAGTSNSYTVAEKEQTGWMFTVGSNFGVDKDGILYANGANISGEINAQSGKIGGMTVDDNGLIIDTSIHRENSEDGNGNSDSEDLENVGDVIELAGTATRFHINSKQYGYTDIEYDRNPSDILPLYLEVNDAYWQYTPSVPFYLGIDGELYTSKIKATGGKIGNLELNSDGILLDAKESNGKEVFISDQGFIRFSSDIGTFNESTTRFTGEGIFFNDNEENSRSNSICNSGDGILFNSSYESGSTTSITMNPSKIKIKTYFDEESFVEVQEKKVLISSSIDDSGEISLTADSIYLNGIKSCYSSGDTISGTIFTAGYITGSSEGLRFSIPLSKPIESGASLNISSFVVTIRQGGKYCCGSSGENGVSPSSTTLTVYDDSIRVAATMRSTTNAINNDACGIHCVYSFTVTE